MSPYYKARIMVSGIDVESNFPAENDKEAEIYLEDKFNDLIDSHIMVKQVRRVKNEICL